MAPDPGDANDLDAAVAVAVADARRRIDAVAGGRRVALLAVTKGFGPAEVSAAVRAGVDGCAENYAQELVAKAEALASVASPPPRLALHRQTAAQQGSSGGRPRSGVAERGPA